MSSLLRRSKLTIYEHIQSLLRLCLQSELLSYSVSSLVPSLSSVLWILHLGLCPNATYHFQLSLSMSALVPKHSY